MDNLHEEIEINQEELEGQEENQTEELFEHHRFTVDKGQSALRIDKFLFDKLTQTSRNKIQEAAAAGNIMVRDKPVKSSYKVQPYDVITIMLSFPPRKIEILPEDIPIDIIYEDESVIVLNKKPGLVVHPSYGHYSGTLVNALAYHLKDLPMFSTGDQRPGLVHRLDKNTTGLLVVAKTEHAKTHLSAQFYERTIERKYIAIVWGYPENEGIIEGHIGRNLKNRKVMDVFPSGEYGKHAKTHYKIIERLGYVTVVQCKLETGRTHQIRAHMKHIKHPLFNDWEYGGDQILKGTTFSKYKQFVQNCFKILPRQALHAKSLGFVNPATGENMFFESEIPDDMQQLIDKWRVYTSSRDW